MPNFALMGFLSEEVRIPIGFSEYRMCHFSTYSPNVGKGSPRSLQGAGGIVTIATLSCVEVYWSS
jgi:hypothetical protein